MTDSIEKLDTPALLIDETIALRNITRFQAHCKDAGLSLRPHIKTHKTIHFARQQIAAGAAGITCQKIAEAEVMAEAGIDDILITFNIVGSDKLARLAALSASLSRLSVTADNLPVVQGLSSTFEQAGKTLSVLVECDTGAGRCGVQSPAQAVELAQAIAALPGLQLAGLMTFPRPGDAQLAADFMRVAVDQLRAQGLPCPVVSTGGSPDMWQAASLGVFTEYRIGTYIYNDRSLLNRNTCQQDDCAASVLATVVSTPTAERAIIDAGSKVLTTDLFGLEGYGQVVDYPDVQIVSLSEEHGILQLSPANCLSVGQCLRIIPNHICVVSNMFDSVWLLDNSGQLQALTIDARGRVL